MVASHKQVEQAAKLSLNAWAISSCFLYFGKKVVCYYIWSQHQVVPKSQPTTIGRHTMRKWLMDLMATSFFNLEDINLQLSFPAAGCFGSNNESQATMKLGVKLMSFPHDNDGIDDAKENEGHIGPFYFDL
jgi:hypothetical protein